MNKLKSSSLSVTRHHIDQVYPRSASSGNTYVISVFAKKAELDLLRLAVRTNDVHVETEGSYLSYADFDLSNGFVKEQVQTSSAGLVDLGDGWYRCWAITYPEDVAGELKITFYLLDADANLSFANVEGAGLYVSGAHILMDTQLKPYVRSTNELPGYTVTVNGTWSIV